MSYESYEFVQTRLEGRILYLTFTRPEVLNATRAEDHTEISSIVDEVAFDDDVDVIVVTGAGAGFSVGGDVTLLEGLTEDAKLREQIESEARRMIHSLVDLEKPLVVALNGAAMGGGLAFGLMGDIIIAERQAKISDGHIQGAIAAGDGGMLTWPVYAGLLRAKRYLLTGDFIPAEEAERIGLVTELVETGESLARATEWAERLAALPQHAVRDTKRALNQWQRMGVSIFDQSLQSEFRNLASPETAEHVRALMKARADAKAAKSGSG